MRIILSLIILIDLIHCKSVKNDITFTEPNLKSSSQITINNLSPIVANPRLGNEMLSDSDSQEFFLGFRTNGPSDTMIYDLDGTHDNLTKSIVFKMAQKVKSDSFYITYTSTKIEDDFPKIKITKTVRGYPIYFDFKDNPKSESNSILDNEKNNKLFVREKSLCEIPTTGVIFNFMYGIPCLPSLIETLPKKVKLCDVPFLGGLFNLISSGEECNVDNDIPILD